MSCNHSHPEIIKNHSVTVFLWGFLLLLSTQSAVAQSFDHTSHPKLDFDLTSLDLELGIQPQNMQIEGAATYQVEANIGGADTLLLNAARMEISSASVDGNDTEFLLHNDSLHIPVADSAEEGQTYEVRIRYSADPRFGLLKNSNSTVWSSQLPQSQRHWVPIIDNPHVTLKTTFNISVPADFKVWATGAKTGEESVNESVTQYQFSSDTEVPASSLALAIGNFTSQSATYGIKRINLAVEQALSDEVDPQTLLQNTYDWLETVEQEMQAEYPYNRLNIVVMDDHNWETKSWGASTIFLYKNRGDLQHQLLRGIIAQWMGARQRAGQWSQADAITLYQVLIQQSLSGSESELEVKDQPELETQSLYDVFGPARWNAWQHQWAQWQDQSWGGIISRTHPDIINQLLPVTNWDDYANYWYQQSGQPMFEPPQLSGQTEDTSETAQTASDSTIYRVQYQLDNAEESIRFTFEATEGGYGYDKLVTLPAYKVYSNSTQTDEVIFTGSNDSVTLSVSPGIETVRLEIPEGLALKLEEHKPVSFLLYDLRNAESLDQRIRAARSLGTHTDNPDLQLAIMDLLDTNPEPEVHAALLTSLADITQGAAGTEQIFLDALENDSRAVQKAGLDALQHYPESSDILSTIKNMTANTEYISVFKQGVTALSGIASDEELETFLAEVARQDTVGHRSIAAIQQLVEQGQTDILSEATRFLDEDYDYGVRKMALKVLTEHDNSPDNWLTRGEELLVESADPRVRYLVVQGLLQNQNTAIVSFLKEFLSDEYDARVYREIEQGLGE